ncbi:MAG: 2-iminoacetate synthase ThiH [Opitutales bacterium]
MMFSEVLPGLPIEALASVSAGASSADVERVLAKGCAESLEDFAVLISPAASGRLEGMAQISQALTQRNFGRTIHLFAPIYLSNECVNVCKYCGFSRHNVIPRVTLPIAQVVHEVGMLARQGFRSLLLVAGEHPKYVSDGYVADVIRACLPIMPGISVELGPAKTEHYVPMVEAGCEGIVVYQESYHKPTYQQMHTAGPKKNFEFRLDTPERAYDAGMRRLGISALYGLHEWRHEALAVAAHALHLQRFCWRAQLSVGLPRLRPAAGGFSPRLENVMSDRQAVQLMCAFRFLLPRADISVTTRERPALRDGMVTVGATHMSAGACTEPGGYSAYSETSWRPLQVQPGEQFHVADDRSPREVAAMIRSRGYEAVWKDFDQCFVSAEPLEGLAS